MQFASQYPLKNFSETLIRSHFLQFCCSDFFFFPTGFIFNNCGGTSFHGPRQYECNRTYTDQKQFVRVIGKGEGKLEGVQVWRVPKTALYRCGVVINCSQITVYHLFELFLWKVICSWLMARTERDVVLILTLVSICN